MFDDNFVIVDLETTALSPVQGEIIEIGAIKVVNNEIVDKMNIFIKPSKPVSYFTTKLTGITNDMLKDGYHIKEALEIFDDFSDGMRLMAHNAKFDLSFLNCYMDAHLNKCCSENVMDTLMLSRAILKDVPNHKLGTLAEYFDIDYTGAHRSLKDCDITYDVYNNIRNIYENGN